MTKKITEQAVELAVNPETTKIPGGTKTNEMPKYGFVKPVAHKNVEGKELYYLSVWNEKGDQMYINIGKGTFEKCSEIVNDAPVIDTIDGV